ncbi:MAG: HAD-IIB family hydrolase [Gammaproteobacteria bacterium]|nr:HAD-IIB family hydrolase [Gammaproteobacteria bacterium]
MIKSDEKLYILLISVHGLIRGNQLELGRDADTGGQTKYVVELARALGEHPQVCRVDLITQRLQDASLDKDYSRGLEVLSDHAQIVRIDGGESNYLPKEELWDNLDVFADNVLDYLRQQPDLPDVIHSHYADAGYVGSRLSSLLEIPLVHTGHSLGRVKRRRLLASGLKQVDIDKRYNMSRRIDAEEETLGVAELVITSTHQEIEEQYGLYDFYQPQYMSVIPPGTDLLRFFPLRGNERQSDIYQQLKRFLTEPEKPVILAISRPDHRKNITTLVEAYGESTELQRLANLVIIAGNRNDIREMDEGAQEVLSDLLMAVDSYDLYGKVAYPKHHQPDDVSILYRLAALSKGVFINPALTEPFGLTLIEAAACGLPIVATEDGGPKDIINNCENGYLIDPLDKSAMSEALLKVMMDGGSWKQMAENGIKGVQKYYSWQAHVDKYIRTIKPLLEQQTKKDKAGMKRRPMMYHERAIFSDLDQNLLGVPTSLPVFIKVLKDNKKCATFGIATGRRLDSALKELKRFAIPQPDVLITSLGTEIYYAPNLTRDKAWAEHIDYLWKPGVVRRILSELPGLKLQPRSEQSAFKVSYYIDPNKSPTVDEIIRLLHQHDQTVNVFLSFGQYLDIVPVRASKGFALRWYANQWDIPLEHILAAGGSGTDEDMMRGNTLAVVVSNRHNEELSDLTDLERVYFARQAGAAGIVEAIEHYDFFDTCMVPKN